MTKTKKTVAEILRKAANSTRHPACELRELVGITESCSPLNCSECEAITYTVLAKMLGWDSQEAIDADALKGPCEYFNHEIPMKCEDCPRGNGEEDVDYTSCSAAQKLDLLERQRKLVRGEQHD